MQVIEQAASHKIVHHDDHDNPLPFELQFLTPAKPKRRGAPVDITGRIRFKTLDAAQTAAAAVQKYAKPERVAPKRIGKPLGPGAYGSEPPSWLGERWGEYRWDRKRKDYIQEYRTVRDTMVALGFSDGRRKAWLADGGPVPISAEVYAQLEPLRGARVEYLVSHRFDLTPVYLALTIDEHGNRWAAFEDAGEIGAAKPIDVGGNLKAIEAGYYQYTALDGVVCEIRRRASKWYAYISGSDDGDHYRSAKFDSLKDAKRAAAKWHAERQAQAATTQAAATFADRLLLIELGAAQDAA